MSLENFSLQDRAIENSEYDLLDRGPFVKSLIRTLIKQQPDSEGKGICQTTDYIVGLTGAWGLGKSSILNMTAERLNKFENVVPVVFNPWLFSGRDELIDGFFTELRNALGSSLDEHIREFRDQVDKYWETITFLSKTGALIADTTFGAGGIASIAASKIADLRPGKPPLRSAQQERKTLEEKLAKSKLAIVVLVDELDRVEDEEIRAVAQLVKAIGEIKGISYLVAYEPTRVAEALGRGEKDERIKSGELYLEKIIQHPIPLRPLFHEDVEILLNHALENHLERLPVPNDSQKKTFEILKQEISTPREIKRLIGTYSIIANSVRGEVCPFETLAYSWIISRSPILQRKIADNIDQLVNDPPVKEVYTRLRDEKGISVISILGPESVPYEKLLDHLFPRFKSSVNLIERQGMRISRRHNLIRLLYLGDPPSLISIKKVKEIWDISDASEMFAVLSILKEEDRIPSFLDRAADVIDQLDSAGDRVFWPVISKLYTRKDDWITKPDANRNIAHDASSLINWLSQHDIERSKKIINLLINADDLVLVPNFLRPHMYNYGFVGNNPHQAQAGFLFSIEETKALMEQEIPRYKKAILDGTALRRLPTADAIYAIDNLALWDEELRASFTDQLDSKEAIATLASLLVPPGYETDKASLNVLFDTEIVQRKLNNFKELSDWPEDPWVSASVKRLEGILSGDQSVFRDNHT